MQVLPTSYFRHILTLQKMCIKSYVLRSRSWSRLRVKNARSRSRPKTGRLRNPALNIGINLLIYNYARIMHRSVISEEETI